MSDGVNDGLIRDLKRTLDRASFGATTVAANLANVDTPGYRAKRAEFTDSLTRAVSGLEQTDPRHMNGAGVIRSSTTRLVDAPYDRMRMDGNTVDLDRELTTMSMVKGRFTAAAQMVRKRFALLRYAMTDGRHT